jgi:hypothetical protein
MGSNPQGGFQAGRQATRGWAAAAGGVRLHRIVRTEEDLASETESDELSSRHLWAGGAGSVHRAFAGITK